MSLHSSAWVCTALALMPASSRGNCVPVHGLLQTTCTPNAGRGGAEGWNSVGIAHSPRFPPGDARNPKPPRGICLQSPFSFCFVGQGLISVFGFILDIGLALLILIISGYAVFLCYQQGWCWCREYGQSRGQAAAGQGGDKGGVWRARMAFAGPQNLHAGWLEGA